MKVKDIMTEDVVTCAPDETLHDAALKMHRENIGCCPVTDNGLLVGILTDRDITVRAVARGDDVNKKTVGSVMTPEPDYGRPGDDDRGRLPADVQQSDPQAAGCRDGTPGGYRVTGEPGNRPRRGRDARGDPGKDLRAKSQVSRKSESRNYMPTTYEE